MDAGTLLDVKQLEAILICDQSDGYLKKWAGFGLEEIQYRKELISELIKTPVPVG